MRKIIGATHAQFFTSRATALLLITGLLGCYIFLQRSRASGLPGGRDGAAAPAVKDKPQQKGEDKDKYRCKDCARLGNQSIYVPLVELPEAQGGELVFNSRSPKDIAVTPVFYKRDGSAVTCKPVNVQSGEIIYADVKSLMPAGHRNEHDWGGMSLNYYGGNREIWSQFRFIDVNGGGSSVDEFFTVKDEPRSDVQEAVWWMPGRSKAIIALGNVTDTATAATVTFGDGRTEEVKLTSAAITAQPKFIPSGGEDAGPVVLPEITLGPNEAAEVDLSTLT
jgi:hypothetical protein